MTPREMQILERLREGPLPTTDHMAVDVMSKESLKVLVYRLRAQGHDIRIDRSDRASDRRCYVGRYVLAHEARF